LIYVAYVLTTGNTNLEPNIRTAIIDLIDPCGSTAMEVFMPIILWLLGVPLVVVIALMLTHVI
jgi:hypothetical protein